MNVSQKEILSVSFSTNGEFIVIGTNVGFGIYETNGLKLRHFAECGGVSICEMLGNSNLVIAVGAGELPEFSQKALKIWDMKNNKKVAELNMENEKILNVKGNTSVIAVQTKFNLFTYDLPNVSLKRMIDCYNPEGVMALSTGPTENLIAYVNHDGTNCNLFLSGALDQEFTGQI